MTKATPTHIQSFISSSLMPRTEQYLHNLRTNSGPNSEIVGISLDISSIILSTLRDACRVTPVPLLSIAAGIAIDIVAAVQRTRRNKNGFKALANDSCELVYVIIRAHKDISKAEDVPSDLIENLQQLVRTMKSIQIFAERGASQNPLISFFRSSVDAEKIQEYREKLRQSMRVFGLQSDIILRETVARLASQQVEMMNELKARATPDPGSSSGRANMSSLTLSTSGSPTDSKPQIPVENPGKMTLEKTSTEETINTTAENNTLVAGNTFQTYGGRITMGIVGACIGITIVIAHKVFQGRFQSFVK